MDIRINTAVVSSTADQIDVINKRIRDDMSDMETAIRTLRQSWEGEGASSCSGKLDYIKNNFSDTRFSVIDGMVSFMKMQVGEGYESTEQAVSSAASAFK